MSRPVLIAEGTFSKLTIELNDSVVQKLAFIPKKDNPLASVEQQMKKVLNDFEVAYFNFTHQADTEVTDLPITDSSQVEDTPRRPNPSQQSETTS